MTIKANSDIGIRLYYENISHDKNKPYVVTAVDFRPLIEGGFSIYRWKQGVEGQLCKVYDGEASITWRYAARFILENNERIIKWEGFEPKVDGVEGYQAALLMACWSGAALESSCRAMFSLSDDELQLLWNAAGLGHVEGEESALNATCLFLSFIEAFGILILEGLPYRSLSEFASVLKFELSDPESVRYVMDNFNAADGMERWISEKCMRICNRARCVYVPSVFPTSDKTSINCQASLLMG